MQYHLSVHLIEAHTSTYNFDNLNEITNETNFIDFLIKKLISGQAMLFNGDGSICFLSASKINEDNKKCLKIIIQKNGLDLMSSDLFFNMKLHKNFKSEEITKYGNILLIYCLNNEKINNI